jgi:mannose/cellobiose epimerase-like protein (N-acyl-D-glucosamine 2-epimerase family)
MNMTSSVYADIRSWMFEDALPWWSEHGIDRENGGYVESFDMAGFDSGSDFKRTRVTARQVYVFSHAAMLGWKDGAELARHGVSHLTTKAWLGDTEGFARRTTRAGAPLDRTPDLYDHAFALFAFGWYLRATGDKEGMAWAHRTMDVIETNLSHPSGVGFLHEAPGTGWRQQNPHMHLIEAALAVYETSGEQRFADVALRIAQLFREKFFDTKSQTLAEFFTDDWSRAPGDAGDSIEPGHQFEWAWILGNCRRLLGLDLSSEIRGLVTFGERYGVNPVSAATYNIVRANGQPVDRGSRTWPNTERLKAAVALHDLDGRNPEEVFESAGKLLLDRYLDVEPRGTWIDAFDGEGLAVVKSVPTSTLYHVFLAFAETLRIGEQLGRK